jgi:hypothetical protein
MRTVFIEARPKDRPDQEPVIDYVAEDASGQVLRVFRSQADAIQWAKGQGYSTLIGRARQFNDKKIPHHWRSV